MKQILRLWWAFAVRAALALGLAVLMFFGQGFLRDEFIEMIAVPFVVTGLILYGIFDSLILLVMSGSISHLQTLRKLILFQGGSGIAASMLLAFLLFEKATLFWFVAIAFCQLGLLGALELLAATHLRRHLGLEVFLGGAGFASILSALALPLLVQQSSFQLAYWLIAYALAMGICFSITAISLRRLDSHVWRVAHG